MTDPVARQCLACRNASAARVPRRASRWRVVRMPRSRLIDLHPDPASFLARGEGVDRFHLLGAGPGEDPFRVVVVAGVRIAGVVVAGQSISRRTRCRPWVGPGAGRSARPRSRRQPMCGRPAPDCPRPAPGRPDHLAPRVPSSPAAAILVAGQLSASSREAPAPTPASLPPANARADQLTSPSRSMVQVAARPRQSGPVGTGGQEPRHVRRVARRAAPPRHDTWHQGR